MIFIYSSYTDLSTNYVIDWLNHFNIEWERVNEFEFGKQIKIVLKYDDDFTNYSTFNNSSKFERFKVIWLRRYSYSTELVINEAVDIGLIQEILHNLEIERKSVWQSLNRNLSSKKVLNSFDSVSVSKIKQLETAIKCGLKIPKTIITTKKSELLKFYSENKNNIISKPIETYNSLVINESSYTPYTKIINDSFINELSEDFFPMLFQENIEKEFEIRTFYLDGEFFSMAMFTQDE